MVARGKKGRQDHHAKQLDAFLSVLQTNPCVEDVERVVKASPDMLRKSPLFHEPGRPTATLISSNRANTAKASQPTVISGMRLRKTGLLHHSMLPGVTYCPACRNATSLP